MPTGKIMQKSAFNFAKNHCNIGVLMLSVRLAEINISDLLVRMEFEKDHLEYSLGFSIPSFEDQLEKFRTEFGYRTIDELTEELDDDSCKTGQFNNEGYVNFEDQMLLVETLYLLYFAAAFFEQKTNFNSQSKISIEQYVIQCADHVTLDILNGSQALDYRFTDHQYAQQEPVMKALSPPITTLHKLSEYDAMNHAMQMNSFDGVRWLAKFSSEITNNLLSLNEDFASGVFTYLY